MLKRKEVVEIQCSVVPICQRFQFCCEFWQEWTSDLLYCWLFFGFQVKWRLFIPLKRSLYQALAVKDCSEVSCLRQLPWAGKMWMRLETETVLSSSIPSLPLLDNISVKLRSAKQYYCILQASASSVAKYFCAKFANQFCCSAIM